MGHRLLTNRTRFEKIFLSTPRFHFPGSQRFETQPLGRFFSKSGHGSLKMNQDLDRFQQLDLVFVRSYPSYVEVILCHMEPPNDMFTV